MEQPRKGRQSGEATVDESTAALCDEMRGGRYTTTMKLAGSKPQKLGSGNEMVFKQNI